jgi:tetratricopeptide (TPR) repeat protein
MRTLTTSVTFGLAVVLAAAPLPHSLVAGEQPAPTVATAAPEGELRDTLQPGLAPDAVRRYAKAMSLRKQGDFDGAKPLLESLTVDYPSYYNALVTLGQLYDFRRERRQALETMERAQAVQKEEKIPNAEASYHLGLMYLTIEQAQPARDAFLNGIAVEASNSPEMNGRLYNGLGSSYALLKEDEKSIQAHTIAAEKYGNFLSVSRLKLTADKAKIDRQLRLADSAIKTDAMTGYDLTTTLPLPQEPSVEHGSFDLEAVLPGPISTGKEPPAAKTPGQVEKELPGPISSGRSPNAVPKVRPGLPTYNHPNAPQPAPAPPKPSEASKPAEAPNVGAGTVGN